MRIVYTTPYIPALQCSTSSPAPNVLTRLRSRSRLTLPACSPHLTFSFAFPVCCNCVPSDRSPRYLPSLSFRRLPASLTVRCIKPRADLVPPLAATGRRCRRPPAFSPPFMRLTMSYPVASLLTTEPFTFTSPDALAPERDPRCFFFTAMGLRRRTRRAAPGSSPIEVDL
ncbi:hypothetical protein PYCCODRAFT_81588 [Trametes coccinea BRFM310]|uniref:Uncharacterized protein n=1 Tax=Trametes coccinea (strain BRFM310) TaxID=1353009 RepID=A0A1Y2IUR6_TRAC3|nr:hypothetical protein PYCCODRAFT_81588 [Trametes coccinea BRFM310]